MEYLFAFLVGIVIYNYLLPLMEAFISCFIILCMRFKTKHEIAINEEKCKFQIKYGGQASAIGFNTNEYPSEEELEFDDEDDCEEVEKIEIGFRKKG